MTRPERARVVELRPRRSRSRAALVALRPRQWSKNLLLFAGIVFAAELGDAVRWGEAAAIFVAYCAASSAAYLVNDLRDAEDDRLHPVKRYRPIARGELQPERALLALFLGLAKRRGELVLVHAEATPGRPALAGYSLKLVDVLLNAVAAATAVAYAVYAVAAHSAWMALTVPFVVVGLGRYLFLVHRHDLGEEPEHVLLGDRVILASVGGWAIASAVVLTVT